MSVPAQIRDGLREARKLVGCDQVNEAEKLYRKLLSGGDSDEIVYRELFQLYVRQSKPEMAMSCIEEMARVFHDAPEWWHQLAQYAQSCGNHRKAIYGYQKFLERMPDRANSMYNLAYLLKQTGRLEEALGWYERSLSQGVSGREEVYTNMGVILSELRRESEARELYEKALKVRPEYLPALLNLAAFFEESGDRKSAFELYSKALTLDPGCVLAMCRLAYLTTASHSDEPLLKRISSMLQGNRTTKGEAEELHFALGKLLDDCGEFSRAFSSYSRANKLGEARFTPYRKEDQSRYVNELINAFSDASAESPRSQLSGAPVFIVGMFRSGSTLVEQVLSGHSHITAGGELDFFPGLVGDLGSRYPVELSRFEPEFYAKVGKDYCDFLAGRFGAETTITDKRPDNFLHIGLIKRALPKSRIIWTRRGILDNCLSVYFQQLGGGMNYSVDLDAIGHFYVEQERLMRHWQSLFPESILDVEYEKLVMAPEAEVRRMLEFLGLGWEEACLDFQQRDNYVKTASIWQVRKGLHSGSINRCKNYRGYTSVLDKYVSSDEQ